MDFKFTREQMDIQKAVREFAENEFDKEYALEIERSRRFPWKVFKRGRALGFVGIDIPEQYGGQGYGLLERVIVTEGFSRSGAGVGLHTSHPGLGIEIILWSGTEDQKKRYLPPLCRGEALLASAFTEPDRGSDLVSSPLSTSAAKDADHYIIKWYKDFYHPCQYCQVHHRALPNRS